MFGFVYGKFSEDDIKVVKWVFERVKELVLSGEWDFVIFDEVCVVFGFGMFGVEEVKEVIKNKVENIEFVFIGRYCLEEFFELVDYVIEMREVKYLY